jgi:hypothetical protein
MSRHLSGRLERLEGRDEAARGVEEVARFEASARALMSPCADGLEGVAARAARVAAGEPSAEDRAVLAGLDPADCSAVAGELARFLAWI